MNTHDSLILEHTDQSVSSIDSAWNRAGIVAYGVASYLVGVTALVGLILIMLGALHFTGGPIHIESPARAVLFNVGWLALFALQHSVMARASFKERWVRIMHPAAERSTYVLATGIVLLPLLWMWQPLPTVLWSVQAPFARGAVSAVAVFGWAYLFVATFAIDHFELFGLQQVWRNFRGAASAPVPFRERWMYRVDRHPIMTGVLVGMWVTPEMTVGHLLFAAVASVYVVIGVHFEERALRRQWGSAYASYRRRVGSIVPLPWSR
ncbi:MAG: methyltransferase family protein [Gemmatimonadaceae bacterium]